MSYNFPEVNYKEGMSAEELKSQLDAFSKAHKAAIDAESAKLHSVPFGSMKEFDNFFMDTNATLKF